MDARLMFSGIYRAKKWATAGVLSGNGSRVPGCLPLIDWLSCCHDDGMDSVCDLGCGDLEWISHVPAVTEGHLRYHGVDVVPELIAHHRRIFPWFSGEAADLEALADWKIAGRNAEVIILKDVLFHLCTGAAEQVLSNVLRWPAWKRFLVSTHAGVHNGRRRIKGAGHVPFDAEAAVKAMKLDLHPASRRIARPDGGEWIVWERENS